MTNLNYFYATCSYAVMSHKTNHLLMINPSPRPVKIGRDEVVGVYEPFEPNTPYPYYGAAVATTHATQPQVSSAKGSDVAHGAFAAEVKWNPVTPSKSTPIERNENMRGGVLDQIDLTLGLDDPELTWHDGVDTPIDPFGLQNEFR